MSESKCPKCNAIFDNNIHDGKCLDCGTRLVKKETESTPGPWKKERYNSKSPWQISDGDTVLAKITDSVHDDYAAKIAALIAAAPELLEACKITLKTLDCMTTAEFSKGGDLPLRILLSATIEKTKSK